MSYLKEFSAEKTEMIELGNNLKPLETVTIDYENDRTGERSLMRKSDDWLMDKVLYGTDSRIFLPQLYYALTKDETDDGCLQYLNGEINFDVRYIDLLAWTGLRYVIKKRFSWEEFKMRQDEIFNRFETTMGIKRHVGSGQIVEYLNKILKSKISVDQFKYVFNNQKGFRQGDKKLSVENCLDYVEFATKANCFEREKKMEFEEKAMGFKNGNKSISFYSKFSKV